MKEISYRLFFKVFSNKTRFEIIRLLRKGPKSVTEMCKELKFEQSRVSHKKWIDEVKGNTQDKN